MEVNEEEITKELKKLDNYDFLSCIEAALEGRLEDFNYSNLTDLKSYEQQMITLYFLLKDR